MLESVAGEGEARTTVPFDTLLGIGAGAALALAARRPLARTDDPIHTRYFAVTALWSAAVLAPTGLVLYAEFPDWSLMYLANPAHLSPILMFPVVLALYLGAPLLGFLAAHKLIRLEREVLLQRSLAALAVAMALVAVVGRDRLLGVAYYDAFHGGGEVISVFRSSLLLALFPCSVAIAGILAFAVMSVRRHAEVAETLPPGAGVTQGFGDGLDKTAVRTKPIDPRARKPANLPRPPQGATPGT